MPTLESGQVFERYRVIRWLGSGVSGESYEAEDSMLLRKVTLKLIHPQSTLPDSARRQFFRELQGISALNHPYLAPVLDYGELNGRLYIARTFVDNGSLLGTEGRLWFRPPLNLSDAIHFTHQLAQALHFIHIRGYLHGAITFSNILVLRGPILDNAPDYAPFSLADVGLANFVRRYGQDQKSLLPVTAAPEQLDRRVIPASDQFALAVLLYFWLAGRPPYLGTPEEIEHLKLSETVVPLSTLNTRVTIKQDGILLRALSAHPEDRYPSLLAFAEALLKTLPPPPVIPITEPAQFDGIATSISAPSAAERDEEQKIDAHANGAVSQHLEAEIPAPTTEEPTIPITAFPEEPVVARAPDEEEQTAGDFDSQAPVSLVLAAADEQSQVVESEPATQFGTVPQTDPVAIHEPAELSETEEPEIIATAGEDNPQAPDTGEIDQAAGQPEVPLEQIDVARFIIASPYADESYEVTLNGDELTIGRAGSSSILLDKDNLTSRHHALLKRKGSHYQVFDMRSANGVFVNGQKIVVESGYELLDGDHIGIGNYELIFRSGTSPTQTKATTTRELQPDTDYEITQLV